MITGLAATTPVSIAVAAAGNAYVVNGLARGNVIANVSASLTAYSIGVTKASTISAASVTSPMYYYVAGVQVKAGGENYRSPPAVSITGVTGAKAVLLADSVADITIVTSATTHTRPPGVAISTSAQASNAAVTATMKGRVVAVRVSPYSGYYSSAPDVTFTAGGSVTEVRPARARGVLTYSSLAATSGRLAGAVVTDPGEYTWDGAGVSGAVLSATVSPPLAGSTPGLVVDASAAVNAITISNSGTDYTSAPAVKFTSTGPNKRGAGAIALASLDGTTQVASLSLAAGGEGYDGGVTVSLVSDRAVAVAAIEPRMSGQYRLAARYIRPDGTPGDLCDLVLVDCKDAASSITWTLTSLSPPAGHKTELWRTSSDQATVLYRVVTLDTVLPATYLDTLPDSQLIDPDRNSTTTYTVSAATYQAVNKYDELSILTAEGYPNAYRFGLPPSNMSVVTLFQDRAWYSVDSTLAEPNTIYFSGIGEHESVPDTNQVIIESTGRNVDKITGLMPMSGALYVGQRSHIVRLTVGDDPLAQGSAVPVSQRGMLNDRCWDQFEGVAYIADSLGVHAFDGSRSESLSDAISTYFTSPLIDFGKSKWFFLRVNAAERTVRFYYAPTGSASSFPTAALCYSLVTKAWWSETFGKDIASGVRAQGASGLVDVVGGPGKIYRTTATTTDDGVSIPFSFRTGAMPLNSDPKRAARITYTPTSGSQEIGLRMYYNNSSSPRQNAVASTRGTGFTTDTGSTEAVLDLDAARSVLGTATGFAQASFSGRIDDNSAGADRVMAIEMAGTVSRPIVLHSLQVDGVG